MTRSNCPHCNRSFKRISSLQRHAQIDCPKNPGTAAWKVRNRASNAVKTYAILYSYPTWDRNYRGQRGVRVEARSEADAIAKIRRGAAGYGPCPDAQIVRAAVR